MSDRGGRLRHRALAAVLVVGVIGAACGTAAPDVTETTTTTEAAITSTTAGSTTTAPATRFGGGAVWGDDQEPDSLNPFAPGGDNFITRKIGQAIHARGWDWDPVAQQIAPDVLLEIPSAGNGGVVLNGDGTMTVSYRIRDEAVWSDGVPVSGGDLAFTIDTLAPLVDPEGFGAVDPLYARIVAHEAGDKTITVTIDGPTIAYEQLFEWILPRHVVEGTDLAADWNEEPFPGAGPFVFESWDRGERVTLVRNQNYWKVDAETGDALPYLDELVFEFMPETAGLIRAFVARALDVIEPPPFAASRVGLPSDEPGLDFHLLIGPIWEHIAFEFGPNNRNVDSINRNLAYRRAVAHAIGDSLDDVISHWIPIDSYLDAIAPGLSTLAWDRYPYDPDAARALLAQAMEEEGVTSVRAVFSTTSNAEERPRLAQELQATLEAVGIEYENQLEDSQLFFGETAVSGTFDLGQWAWVGDPSRAALVSILDVFDPDAPPPEGINYYRWGTPDSSVRDGYTERFTEILAALRTSIDGEEIDRLLVEAEQLLADQVVIIPLAARAYTLAVWADELGGVVPNPTDDSSLWNVEEWYRTDR